MNGENGVASDSFSLDSVVIGAFACMRFSVDVVHGLGRSGVGVSRYHALLAECSKLSAEIVRLDCSGVPAYAMIEAVKQLYSRLADFGSLVVHDRVNPYATDFGYHLWSFAEHVSSHCDILPLARVDAGRIALLGGSSLPSQK